MKIGIGSDHRGFRLKNLIVKFLRQKKIKVIDLGTDSEIPVDYPDYALKVTGAIRKKKVRFGILLCFTGQGMAMMANKVRGIRAAICTKPAIARLARRHNNANVLVIPAGLVRFSKGLQDTIEVFLNTRFEGGRHQRRLKIMEKYENGQYGQ